MCRSLSTYNGKIVLTTSKEGMMHLRALSRHSAKSRHTNKNRTMRQRSADFCARLFSPFFKKRARICLSFRNLPALISPPQALWHCLICFLSLSFLFTFSFSPFVFHLCVSPFPFSSLHPIQSIWFCIILKLYILWEDFGWYRIKHASAQILLYLHIHHVYIYI